MVKKAFHRYYLTTAGAILAFCAVALGFLNAFAYAQGTPPAQPETPAIEQIVKIAGYLGLFLGGLSFAVGYVWSLWKQKNIEQEKENTATWQNLAETRLQKSAALQAENAELKSEQKTLRERLRKQKKLTLRLIAKLEGEGDEFDESEDDE